MIFMQALRLVDLLLQGQINSRQFDSTRGRINVGGGGGGKLSWSRAELLKVESPSLCERSSSGSAHHLGWDRNRRIIMAQAISSQAQEEAVKQKSDHKCEEAPIGERVEEFVDVFEEDGMPEQIGVPETGYPDEDYAVGDEEEAAAVHHKPHHHMLTPFTAAKQLKDSRPLVITKSEGIYVYDSNDKKYLDALAGLWCTSLGGSEKRLVKAATEQMEKLPFYHSFWHRTTECAMELASELLDMFTARKMAKVFFTNSGSEANDTQVKLVWYYNNARGKPNKKKIIARNKSYHGSTLVTASLTGLGSLHQGFDLPVPFVLHTDCPHYWRYHLPGETEEDYATRLADNLDKLIEKEGADTVAAFIAEPVMGAGGVILPPDTYFEKVQKVLKKHDVLFIADEVVCAFGRLGSWFGCDKYNIHPDLVTLAKALSAAYQPIGAILISQEMTDEINAHSDRIGTFAHGFTYSGHPVACAVALETLKIYKERQIVDHVNVVGPLFQDGMKALASSPIIGEVRGAGLILGVEFVNDKEQKTAFPADWGVATYLAGRCAHHGMLVRVSGDQIMMSPPLIITEAEVNELVFTFTRALHETESMVEARKNGTWEI